MMTNNSTLATKLTPGRAFFRSAQTHRTHHRTGYYLILLRQHHAARNRWRPNASIRFGENLQ
jgi:hypothetical protein